MLIDYTRKAIHITASAANNMYTVHIRYIAAYATTLSRFFKQ